MKPCLWQTYDLIIIAIIKADDQMIFNPSFEVQLTTGDTLIAVGEPTNLNRLRKVLNPLVRNDTRGMDVR